MTAGHVMRAAFVVAVVALAAGMRPLAALTPDGVRLLPNLVLGALLALTGVLAERLVREVDPRAAAAALLGATVSGLLAGAALRALPPRWGAYRVALEPFLTLIAVFLGAGVGARAAARPEPARPAEPATPHPEARARPKILDTSAIIDGRIAEMAGTGFIDGPVTIPRFVMRELQRIADSNDPSRRARGRRGLDSLETLKASSRVDVVFSDDEGPEATEVDDALLALAARTGARLVTTDFNLAKIAGLRGIEVLNVNALASTLRPGLLPGDSVRVRVLKEGKEAGQGVGYLDDGTMVVVEGGRESIGRVVDLVVTGSLQTPAGKMFFGRPSSRDTDTSDP